MPGNVPMHENPSAHFLYAVKMLEKSRSLLKESKKLNDKVSKYYDKYPHESFLKRITDSLLKFGWWVA